MRRLSLASSAALLALAGCSSTAIVPPSAERAPAPAPRPAPMPAPAPTPTPTQAPGADWRDWALTPGNWVYRREARGSVALYGRSGADPEASLRCDTANGRLVLARRGEGPMALTVRTSSTLKTLTAERIAASPGYVAAELAARDPLVDAMGFSRGRFIIESRGAPTLVLPAWPEILRVAEDCRS